EFESKQYAAAIDRSFDSALHRVVLRSLFVPAVILFGFVGIGVVVWYGGRLAISGAMQSGDLVGFLLITLFVAGSVGSFTGLWAQLQEAIGASRRIFELLDETSDMEEPAEPVVPTHVEGYVEFEELSFGYPDRRGAVLEEVSLTAR